MGKRGVRNILVLMPDRHMGNLIVSIPAIQGLREFYIDARFYLAIDSRYTEVVEAVAGLDSLIPYPREEMVKGSYFKHSFLFLQFVRRLRGARPDVAIDLCGREYSSVLTLLSGASIRYGPAISKRAFLYNRRVTFSDRDHKLFSYLDIASAAGADTTVRFNLRPSDSKRLSLMEKLRGHGVELDRGIVCIHPGAGKVYKLWSLEGFAEISDWLYSKGIQVVFIGGEEDGRIIKEIGLITRYPFYNTAGMLSLGELMALFERSSLFIGNDSGPMHLAGAMNLPIVGLFGPADERRWGPLTDKKVILRGRERCQRCYGKDCDLGFQCIKGVRVEDVKRGIEDLLKDAMERQAG
jgi:heptosyltransferase-3